MDEVIVQDDPVPEEADRYPGKWVAIRDRKVVAAADTLAELRKNPCVRRRDMVHKVPLPGPRFYYRNEALDPL